MSSRQALLSRLNQQPNKATIMPIDREHSFVGRKVVYRDPYKDRPEEGVVTSVNVEANLVFVRYGLGSMSAATEADERLTFLNGEQVRLEPTST